MGLARRMLVLAIVAMALVPLFLYLIATEQEAIERSCRSGTWNCSWGPAFAAAGARAAVGPAVAIGALALVASQRARHGRSVPPAWWGVVVVLALLILASACRQLIERQYDRAYPQCEVEGTTSHDWSCIDRKVTLDERLDPIVGISYGAALAVGVLSLARWRDPRG